MVANRVPTEPRPPALRTRVPFRVRVPFQFEIPLWSWLNLFSLDAVAVGLLWQCVFTFAFCGRSPTLAESMMIGLPIWLAYTADRLLDSMRLDLSRPHTLRHRVHLEWRGCLIGLWIVVLAIETALVVTQASEAQLRWGCVAVALVMGYIAAAQIAGGSARWIPKELQAGMVFAFGTSLLPWSEVAKSDVVALFVSTLMAGALFTINCIAVAYWEREIDANQGFASWITHSPAVSRWMPNALRVHVLLSFGLYVVHVIPFSITLCFLISNLLMWFALAANRNSMRQSAGRTVTLQTETLQTETLQTETLRADTLMSGWNLVADMTLVIPPSVWIVVGQIAG